MKKVLAVAKVFLRFALEIRATEKRYREFCKMTRKSTILEPIDLDSLDAGIRDVVRDLREHWFETTDSGDGTSTIESAIGYPHVFCVCSKEKLLTEEAHRLRDVANQLGLTREKGWLVEGSYSPDDDIGILMLMKPPFDG